MRWTRSSVTSLAAAAALALCLLARGGDAQTNLLCHACYYLEGNESPTTDMFVNLLLNYGVDTRADYTTAACKHGFPGESDFTDNSAAQMGVIPCDGVCTARIFVENQLLKGKVFQRTCMSAAQVAECVEYTDETPTDAQTLLPELKVTTRCCFEDFCNSLRADAPSARVSTSLIIALLVVAAIFY